MQEELTLTGVSHWMERTWLVFSRTPSSPSTAPAPWNSSTAFFIPPDCPGASSSSSSPSVLGERQGSMGATSPLVD